MWKRQVHVFPNLNNQIAVFVMVKPPTLLRMDRIEPDCVAICLLNNAVKWRQQIRTARVIVVHIALDCRREFHSIKVARLNAPLNQKMKKSASLLTYEGEYSTRHGFDERLLPGGDLAAGSRHVHPDHLEVAPCAMADGFLVNNPSVELIQGHTAHVQVKVRLEMRYPAYELIEVMLGMAVVRHGGVERVLPKACIHRLLDVVGSGWTRRGISNAGEHRTRVHVDDVVDRQQSVDLPESHPAEVLVRLHRLALGDLNDDIPVTLPQEPGALLGLQLVHQHAGAASVEEVIQVSRSRPSVHLRVVASGGLHRWRKLEKVDVAGLHLGLDEKVVDPVDALHQEAQDADLWLIDDGLHPAAGGAEVGGYLQTFHAEELAALVGKIAGLGIYVPPLQPRQGNLRNREVVGVAAILQPLQNRLLAVGALRSKGGLEESALLFTRSQTLPGHRCLRSAAQRSDVQIGKVWTAPYSIPASGAARFRSVRRATLGEIFRPRSDGHRGIVVRAGEDHEHTSRGEIVQPGPYHARQIESPLRRIKQIGLLHVTVGHVYAHGAMHGHRRLVCIAVSMPTAWNPGGNPVHVEDPANLEGEMDTRLHRRKVTSWILDIRKREPANLIKHGAFQYLGSELPTRFASETARTCSTPHRRRSKTPVSLVVTPLESISHDSGISDQQGCSGTMATPTSRVARESRNLTQIPLSQQAGMWCCVPSEA